MNEDLFGFGFGVRYLGDRIQFLAVSRGHCWSVTVPVEVAHRVLDQELALAGLSEPPQVGDLASVDGLFRRGRRAKGKGFKALKKIGRGVLRTVRKAVESKALHRLVAASAVIMPCIGGPALAALTTAKTINKAIKAAEQGGHAAATMVRAAQRGMPALARRSPGAARLMLAAAGSLDR